MEPRPEPPLLVLPCFETVYQEGIDLASDFERFDHPILTLPEIAAARIIPTHEDFAYWYNDPNWVPIEDEESTWEIYDFPGTWTNPSTKASPTPTERRAAYCKVLYSPALLEKEKQRLENFARENATTKRKCRDDSSVSQRQEAPRKRSRRADVSWRPPARKEMKSCPAPTTRTSRKKRRWIRSQ